MKVIRDVLEDHLQEYKQQVIGLKSYIRELKEQTAKHGTEESHYEADLIEAEHNVQYYEDEIARIKKDLGGGAGGGYYPQAGTILPRTARECVGSLVFSAIGFAAGALLVSVMMSKTKDREGGRVR
ncbi:MAG TPA: hypothetical protein VN256_06655 [Pyrinomonadaceae bacterium]|nr:hypothetical protein [Pyrinomonadaceae bacterium]